MHGAGLVFPCQLLRVVMEDDDITADLGGFEEPRLVRREDLPALHRLHALCFPHSKRVADEEAIAAAVASYAQPERGGVYVICRNGEPISKVGYDFNPNNKENRGLRG